jgi:hypothetical protein
MIDSRKSAFQSIPNPYIVGNPIKDPKMFFGREDDFAYVKNKFSGGKEGGMIVLCGARRSGKTSILFQILNGRAGEDFLPVLIDMQSMAIGDDRDLLNKLAQEIVSAIGHAEISIEEYRSKAADNPFTAFEHLVKKIDLVMGDKKLILMFDEYELFETNIDSGIISPKILNLLANLIEHKRVFIVFTGSDNLEARNKPYWGLFLSKALHQRISFLSKGDTLRLVRQPVDGVVRYGEGVAESLYNLTAGQPFYTQVICQSIVDHLNEYRRYTVEAEDVDQVVDEIIENPLPQMIFSWNMLSNLEKLALAIIAELNRETPKPVTAGDILTHAQRESIGYRIDANELNKTLESLFHNDVLRKESDTDAYSFKVDLWRLWVCRMHSGWQVIDEMERSGEELTSKGIYSETVAKRKKTRIIVATVSAAIVVAAGVFSFIMWDKGRSSAGVQDFASLSVRTNPPQANVSVDGTWIGPSPVDQANVPAGSRILRIELAGYLPVIDTLNILKDERRTVTRDLVELTGSVRIESEPSGAAITIDGVKTGLKTPVTKNGLSVNMRHRFDFALAGYQGGSRDGISIYRDSVVTVTQVFSKMSGSLTISSQPMEADAYLDGGFIGKTPKVATDLSYGIHEVKISKNGYGSQTRYIEISKANEEIAVPLSELPPGKIIFSIEPYASVFIDGRLIKEGVQFYPYECSPGRHKVVLSYLDFPPYTVDVEVESNGADTIRHRFSR